MTGRTRPARIARTSLLIRADVADVFKAFVDPEEITGFWLESTSGPLTRDASVRWHFLVPGATETVKVTAFDEETRIAFRWSDGKIVTLTFEAFDRWTTRVAVEVGGFAGEEAVDQIVAATEGFTLVLCELKVLLETGRSAGLVRDKARLIAAG